jgi:hypothetical protein
MYLRSHEWRLEAAMDRKSGILPRRALETSFAIHGCP